MSFKSLVRHINDGLRINFRVHLMIHRNVFKVRNEYRFYLDTVPKIENQILPLRVIALKFFHFCIKSQIFGYLTTKTNKHAIYLFAMKLFLAHHL